MHNKNNEQYDQITTEQEWQTPGLFLRKARRERGLSEEDICGQLGLTNRIFRALESDDLDRLPGPTYVRGYIRRYCTLLGVPSTGVVDSYESYRQEHQDDSPSLGSVPASSVSGPWKKPLLLVVLVAFVIVVAFWVLRGVSESTEAGEPEVSVSQPVDELSDSSLPEIEPLSFEFSDSSWVEVVDARGDILLAGMKQADDRVVLKGTPPFKIRLSNADGVKIHYAGSPVEVKSSTQAKVARITVGN